MVGDSEVDAGNEDRSAAGLLVVWSGDLPRLATLRVPAAGLIVGRDTLTCTNDDRLSRQHARIRWNGTRFQVADLSSRNGTFVGGSLVSDGEITALPPVVVRTGRTISVLCGDVERHEACPMAMVEGAVVGPTLRQAWDAIDRAALTSRVVLLTGESGVGKRMAARRFHTASLATGPLVAVDCAAMAPDAAARRLFGGDGEGAGCVAAAEGGTLVLDEVAELDPEVQVALVRLLESADARPMPARIVVTTHKDLRAEVQAGTFREELYARLGGPEVRIPPLRDRIEDIPWLVAEAVRPSRLPAHPGLVEACLLRPWPGNCRELMDELGRAAQAAVEAGRLAVRAEDLDGAAGRVLTTGELQTIPPHASGRIRVTPVPEPSSILDALRLEDGNVSRAARRLGLHRNQLRRWLAKHPEAAALVAGSLEDDDLSRGTLG